MKIEKATFISNIVDDCIKLPADEELTIPHFGANEDLTLYIHKDVDYNKETNEANLVIVSTMKDGEYVDDTYDTCTHDGSLDNELERIYEYEDFETL